MTGRTRRRLLGELLAATLAGTAAAPLAAAAGRRVGPRPSGRGGRGGDNPISVTLAFPDGRSLTFSEDKAVDLGPYVDPKGEFTQLCRLAAAPGSPWTVFFRPDAGSDRFEVVIELGWPDGDAKHMGPYVATIARGGRKIDQVSASDHYWWSRWRWQSDARPVRGTPAALVAARLVPPFGNPPAGQGRRGKLLRPVPMAWETAGLMKDMGASGEREEIGLLTRSQGDWLRSANAIVEGTMLSQAEAHASVPVHFRDETMAPISIKRYPRASCFWNGAAAGADPWLTHPGRSIRPEKAHYPSLNYIPFLATGDPYHLEELQFAAQFHLLSYNTAYRKYDKGILGDEQTRGWAWGIRALFQAVLATPAETPAWLAPRAYFQEILNHNRSWFMATQVENKDNPMKAVCHFAIDTKVDHIAPWQQDMLSAVLGWAVLAGFSDWRAAYEWHIQQALTRALGRSGYPRSAAVLYYYKSKGVTDWASLAAHNGLTETPDGGFHAKVDKNYAAYLRAALALAKANGVAGADEAFTYADQQVRRLRWLPSKWAFDA